MLRLGWKIRCRSGGDLVDGQLDHVEVSAVIWVRASAAQIARTARAARASVVNRCQDFQRRTWCCVVGP